MFDALRVGLRSALRREALERELDEETRLHLDRSTELHMARGLSRAEAEVAARRDFGNLGVIKEEARDARGVRFLDELRRDVRYALRTLARSPGFATVMVLTLALGFGVNAALFSLFKIVMRPSPVAEASTLVDFPIYLTYADYVHLRDNTRSLSSVLVHSNESTVLADSAGRDPEEVGGEFVSGNFFSELRGRPLLGRVFAPDEVAVPGGAPVVVLSYRFWSRRFGRDSSIVGGIVRLAGGKPFTVIGVMPREFAGADRHTPALWLPLGQREQFPAYYHGAAPVDGWFGQGEKFWLSVQGRIGRRHSLKDVRTEVQLLLSQRNSGREPEMASEVAARLYLANNSGINSRSEMLGVGMVFGATIAVLLIACATVANLTLARATTRRREFGIRLSLGAARWRVVRQLLTESGVMALLAAALGVLLAWGTLHALVVSGGLGAMLEDGDPGLVAERLRPDTSVVAFMMILSLLSAVAFGLAPALRSTRGDLVTSVREGGALGGAATDRSRLRSVLVISQVALTMVLLLACGLLLRSLVRVTSLDLGYDRARVLSVQPVLHLAGYDSLRIRAFYGALEARLATHRGVERLSHGYIPVYVRALAEISVPGQAVATDKRQARTYFNTVSTDFFATLGIRLVRGRPFSDVEVRDQRPVAVVSEATARALWPDRDPIGQVVSIVPYGKAADFGLEGRFVGARVVGVARDAQMIKLGMVDRMYAYLPGNDGALLVRTSRPAAELAGEIRALVRSIDPDLIVNTRSLQEILMSGGSVVEGARVASVFAAGVGLLSLVLAVVGLFGVTAYSVAQRTREFGIRMALGADRRGVLRLVVRQGLGLVAVGAVLGVLGGAAGSRVLSAMLFGLSPLDPVAYVAVAFFLGGVALVACYVPARAATRVDPVRALRAE